MHQFFRLIAALSVMSMYVPCLADVPPIDQMPSSEANYDLDSLESSSHGCDSVNSGTIDLQSKWTTGGGAVSVGVGNFKSSQWLTVHATASVTLAAFVEVYDPRTMAVLQSKLVVDLDPSSGSSLSSATLELSDLGPKLKIRLIAGSEGEGSFEIVARCAKSDPRQLSMMNGAVATEDATGK